MRARTQHRIWRWLAVLALAAAVTVGQVALSQHHGATASLQVADGTEPNGPGGGPRPTG